MGRQDGGYIYFLFFTKYKGYEKSPEEAKEVYDE
jgi:hypothetical protein